MSTSLAPVRVVGLPTVYDRAQNVTEFLANLGRAIHSSGMFGCESPSQGQVLALECAARKMPPLALAERYHLIKGKLSMKADAMLAAFSRDGGSHEIIERSAEKAAVKLVRNRKSHVFDLSWEDAKKEPFVYEGREGDLAFKLAAGDTKSLKLKPKYATPRARTQMLWARVVSDGVRAMAPEVLDGHYAPEEVGDLDGIDLDAIPAEPLGEETVGGEVVAPEPEPAQEAREPDAEQAEIDRLKAEADAGLAKAKATEERLVNETPAEHAKTPPPAAAASAATNGKATPDQVTRVRDLVAELEVPRDKLTAMLQRAKAAKVSDLSVQQCKTLIEAMEREKAKLEGN